MSAQWDVVGVGANSIDRVTVLPGPVQALAPSGKMPIGAQHVLCGGQTATALRACAAFGLRSCYVGAVGDDAEGRLICRTLERHGVDTGHVVVRDAPTATAVILVDGSTGHRIVLWARSAQLGLAAHDISPKLLRAARLVHVDDVDQDAAIETARAARAAGIMVTSDIEQVTARTDELIASVTFAIFDERAPLLLTGEREPERALRKLRLVHGDCVLCMTLGDRGALALEGDRLYQVAPVEVRVVDTTGAGDVFRGGFIHGVLQRWPLADILRFANAAAAASCSRLGAFDSVPSLQEVHDLMRT